MRTLLLLYLLLAASPLASQPPSVAKEQRTKGAQSKEKGNPKKQTSSEETPLKEKTQAPPKQEPAGDKDSEELHINQKLLVFNGVLALVGGLQFIALGIQAYIFWRTLNENRRLINASQKAADAADGNAKALIGGSRGWALVEGPPIITPHFTRAERNHRHFGVNIQIFGQTPCRILRGRIRFHLADMRPLGVPPEPDLPETPEYFGDPYGSNVYRNRTEIPDEGAVLPPGGQFQIRADLESGPLTDSQLQQIKSNESFLCAYGVVTYTDVFGTDCETRFCYIHRETNATRDAGWRIGGPKEYNKQT